MDEVENSFRAAHGRAVATLIRIFGDISLAEEAVQDAYVAALRHWPADGIPANPAGWIVTTARNRATDVVRRNQRGRELYQQLAEDQVSDPAYSQGDTDQGGEDLGPMRDDQLRLIFTCCHPALRVEHQVALTLRLIAGLTPAEVARAFLVPEVTMSKRLVRAKYKIKAANIPYRVPRDAELPARLRAVLAVLYLIYNAGVDDQPQRGDLRSESIRLARLLVALMPDEPEAVGLLAMMLLSESRATARGGADIVLLRDQDRTQWDPVLIAEGHDLVLGCLRRGRLGPYQLQAAIQGLHCAAPTFADTDWRTIVRLYNRLHAVMPTPVVALNRAIAIAELDGPAAALPLVDQVAEPLDGYHLLHATRATLLEQTGRSSEAAEAYHRAAELAPTEAALRFLAHRRDQVSAEHQHHPSSEEKNS